MASTSYCEKIGVIFDAMIHLSDEVLPENRKEVNEYICYVWEEVNTFTRSIKLEKGTEELRTKFKSHVDAEEARLQKNFEDIKYDIDSYDSVQLISGHGRVETVRSLSVHTRSQLNPEQTLLPMLYLLLKRDLQRISLACKHVLSDSELFDAVETIESITLAAQYRITDLRGEKYPITRLLSLPGPPKRYSSSRIYHLRSSSPSLLKVW